MPFIYLSIYLFLSISIYFYLVLSIYTHHTLTLDDAIDLEFLASCPVSTAPHLQGVVESTRLARCRRWWPPPATKFTKFTRGLWKMMEITTGWCVFCHPSENYESQLGWLFPRYGKIKNVPNHEPDHRLFMVIWYSKKISLRIGFWTYFKSKIMEQVTKHI